jgi:hypothetical protein
MVKKKTKKEDEWEEFGKRMEDWGESFGKEMEAKFSCSNKGQGCNVTGIVIGLLIISWGVVWLGNELGFWELSFPFWPIIVILIGLAILLGTIKGAIFHYK